MLHKVDCNVICFEVLIIVWNARAKDGKDQVKRTAVIIRRAVAWALDIRILMILTPGGTSSSPKLI